MKPPIRISGSTSSPAAPSTTYVMGRLLEHVPIAIGGWQGKLVAFLALPGLPGIAARHRAGEGR